jgi:hypothetical protein
MKTFEVVLQNSKNKEKVEFSIEAYEFASAASDAYLKRHTLSRSNNSEWDIVSLAERGWRITTISE